MVWPYSMDALDEMRQLQREVNRLFEQIEPVGTAYPPVNIWGRGDELIVTAELPGVQPEDMDITVEGDQLILRGERKEDEPTKEVVCHRAERGSGIFTRVVQLPYEVESDKVKARIKQGILSITLPRAEASKPKQITIARE